MMHNIHVAHGRCYAIAVKNAAIDERNVFRTRRIGPDVEQADSIASLTEPSRGEIADKTRATGNKVLHLSATSRAHAAAVFNEILPLWPCIHYDENGKASVRGRVCCYVSLMGVS